MIKIRDYLFELVCGFVLLFNACLAFEIILIICTIIYPESIKNLIISIIVFSTVVLVLIIIVLISLAATKNRKKNILIYDNTLIYEGKKYSCAELSFKYYSCKWYYIPIVLFYKGQQGGLIVIYYNNEEIIVTRIFYSEYIKLKKHITNNSIV